jgi:hypothetical protein
VKKQVLLFLLALALGIFVVAFTACDGEVTLNPTSTPAPTQTPTLTPTPTVTPAPIPTPTPTLIPTETAPTSPAIELPSSSYLPEVPRISVEEVKVKLDAGSKLLIVDSRSNAGYEQSHIVGAISLPLGNMAEPYSDLNDYDEIAFY